MGLISRSMNLAVESRFKPSVYNEKLYGFWGGGTRSHSGIYVSESLALTQSAVFACMRIISGMISSLPLITYQHLDGGGKSRAKDYAIYPLLHDMFNEEQTSSEAREMLSNHVVLRGNAFAAIERDRFGEPIRIVPLHPDHVTTKRNPRTLELVYDWNPTDGQVSRTFRSSQHEMLHLRSFIGRDGMTGMSVLEMARESLGMSIALEQFGASLFGNGAQFSGMLKTTHKLGPELHKQLREDFRDKHTGLENAFKPIILEDGMDWVSVGMKSVDAQFLEHRTWQLSDLARWFQVPSFLLNDSTKSTTWGTGLEQETIAFKNFTMMYWLNLWESCIQRDVIPHEDWNKYFVEFQLEGLLRGDSAARSAFYQKMFSMGTYSPNDIRAKENENPVDGGDIRYVPANFVPVGTPPTAAVPAVPDDPTADEPLSDRASEDNPDE